MFTNFFKIVAFTGLMGSGKTYCAKYVYEKLKNKDVLVWYIKFADPIYTYHNFFSPDKKNRLFLQALGDLTKEFFGVEGFASYFGNRISKLIAETFETPKNKYVILDDLRFTYEYDMFEKIRDAFGGYVVPEIYYVHATDDDRKNRIPDTFLNTNHCSETEIPSMMYKPLIKARIYNTTTVEELDNKLNNLFKDDFTNNPDKVLIGEEK